MISVEEAQKLVMDHIHAFEIEEVALEEANGRILAEDIVADRDFPPFNRVMMDGIAINHNVWNSGSKEFEIEAMQTAGADQKILDDKEKCIEVMTGAMLPQNTDAVVRYEDFTMSHDSKAEIEIEEVFPYQNIHLRGTDRKKGEVLIKAGRKVGAAEIAVLATVGKANVGVMSRPKIALVSTGDELVNVNETPHPYQIRKSNMHALQSALEILHYKSDIFHFTDSKSAIENGLSEVFDKYNTVILSGGVSKGKKDYVPEVLDKLEVTQHFHKVRQRPGKPFWFGTRKDGKTVFALPGNPVSTFLCFYKYVKPWLFKSAGIDANDGKAVLTEDFEFGSSLTYFLQVKLQQNDSGVLEAIPVVGKGSGDLANLLEADAFIELPEDKQQFQAGEAYSIIKYR